MISLISGGVSVHYLPHTPFYHHPPHPTPIAAVQAGYIQAFKLPKDDFTDPKDNVRISISRAQRMTYKFCFHELCSYSEVYLEKASTLQLESDTYTLPPKPIPPTLLPRLWPQLSLAVCKLYNTLRPNEQYLS